MRASLTLATALAVFLPNPAQAAPADVAAALAKARLELRAVPNGGFTGSGWDRIVADAASAQFVMVGEQHGSGSIAELETALHATLAERGITHNALEVGPWSTRFAETRVRSGAGALAAYIAAPGNGFALPFLFFAEETAMTEQMVRKSPDRVAALWGLDQEFIGAAPIHLSYLDKAARTPAQRTAVAAYRARAAASPFALAAVTAAEFDALERAFAADRTTAALIAALRRSAAIYAPFVTRKGSAYSANLDREQMMKANFLDAFTAAEARTGKPPRVFFKFGGNHAMRGHSATDVPSLANFVAEWGSARGFRMVNLIVDCDGGQAMSPQSGKAETCAPYLGGDSALAKAVAAGPALQVFALAPLRTELARWKKDIDWVTRQTILAFDYYVAVRDGRAGTLIGAPAVK